MFFCCSPQGHAPSPEVGMGSDVLGVAQQTWAELWQSELPRKVTVQASSLAAASKREPYIVCRNEIINIVHVCYLYLMYMYMYVLYVCMDIKLKTSGKTFYVLAGM